MCRQRERAQGASREKGDEGEESAVGGGVGFAWVGRSTATMFLRNPLAPSAPPPRRPSSRRSLFPARSVSPRVSRFLHASKAALKRYRKIITGKALHTRVRRTAGPTDGITLILVSFGPTD